MSRFLTPLRYAARLSVTRVAPRPSFAAVGRFTPSFHTACVRLAVDPAAAPAALQANEVTERVLAVVKKFEKIKDPNAVNATSMFATDLGTQRTSNERELR
jgi:chemotaxis regulatin CheY-phosphate phosphatase CheZ